LVETITGIYALDCEHKVKLKQVWPNDHKIVAKIMRRLRDGDRSVIGDFISELKKQDNVLIFSDNKLLVDSLKSELNIEISGNLEATRSIKIKLPKLALEAKLINNKSEFGAFSHEVMNEITRMDVHEELSEREALLIPAVQLLGELDMVLNSLSGRMREWYGVHFPEMGNRIRDHMDYARIITKMGYRENITLKGLMEMSIKKSDAESIVGAIEGSVGAFFDAVDMELVSDFAHRTLRLYKYRDSLTEYISMVTNEVAPNVAYIAGSTLGAKLIEKAGGLKRLGMMPSSTIQVIGAEKAMFRAIKSNARPPKHGLLYQHPYVKSAPRNRRGNRARSLAAKIAIAARADLFSGDFIAKQLVTQLEDF
jgi:nucleolar protein 56